MTTEYSSYDLDLELSSGPISGIASNDQDLGLTIISPGSGGGGGVTTYYKKRARDSACSPAQYVTWVTTDPAGTYGGALPCGGPLVDTVIVQVWQE